MCKILLHMEDDFGMDDFTPKRQEALVAIVISSPKEVGTFQVLLV